MNARSASLSAAMSLLPQVASACTVCHSNGGQQLRAALFGAGFFDRLFIVVLPFPALLLAVLLIQFSIPDPGAKEASA